MKKLVMSIAAAALLLSVAGCSSEPKVVESPRTDIYVGKTLAYAMDRVDQDHALVYDLSKPALNKEPSYSDNGNDGQYTIIVNCTASNGIGLGVVLTSDVTESVRKKMQAHEYNSYLAECGK